MALGTAWATLFEAGSAPPRPSRRLTIQPTIGATRNNSFTGTSIHNEGGKGAFSAKPDLLTSRIGSAKPLRTLIGNIQELGGTAVFTFDYSRHASRWVTDDNAFRCFVNGIYDPCLRNPDVPTEYFCIADQDKVLIRNARPDSAPSSVRKSPDEGTPYFVTLTDGTTCRMSSGAGPSAISGYPYWYGSCSGPRAGIWRARIRGRGGSSTAGLLDKTASGTWHVAIEENAAPGKATLYPVAVAYR